MHLNYDFVGKKENITRKQSYYNTVSRNKNFKSLINNYIKMQPEIKKLIIHMVSLSKERKPNMLPLTITFSDILIPRSSSKWGKYSLKMASTIKHS